MTSLLPLLQQLQNSRAKSFLFYRQNKNSLFIVNGEAKQLIPSINTIDFILKMKKLVTMLKDLLTLPLTKV